MSFTVHTGIISVWTVFFVFKLLRKVTVCALICGAFWLGSIYSDHRELTDNIIRLHVVGSSDSEADQALKLQVRDAVVNLLEEAMQELPDQQQAKAFLTEKLEQIQRVAEQTIAAAGFSDTVTVTLDEEVFDTREYDTFTLPAGVYESLRIVIGEGEGKNWWCVVFPSLCLPATEDDFADAAVGAGFDDTLTDTLSNDGDYEIRFFLLDCIGKIQNFFHKG